MAILSLAVFLACLACTASAFSFPITFTDDMGERITLLQRPERVVSLVPAITEILCGIGAGETVRGITYHDTYPAETEGKTVVGGFFAPSLAMIERCNPQIIFAADIHDAIRKGFAQNHPTCRVITLSISSLSDLYATITLLGNVFERKDGAQLLIHDITSDIEVISRKIASIPPSERKRVIRLMGRSEIMTPGDDSFQNEYIRLAGGIPPVLGKTGHIVPVSLAEWKGFNPQVIYGCGQDRHTTQGLLNRPGWRDVEAIKTKNIHMFPCDLTCRMSTRAGAFVSSLAAALYPEHFSNPKEQVLRDGIRSSRLLDIDLDYIHQARIDYSFIHDFMNKTLVVAFREPMEIISTLEGPRKEIDVVGNHSSPPPCWGIEHARGLDHTRKHLFDTLGLDGGGAAFLFTGADMDHLAIERTSFGDRVVYALVTAGVKGNAMRASCDGGSYYEPGTINIILMTNTKLTPRAMTRVLITATEAKTAALGDLDIRSSYTPLSNQATGTGTDNIIVVSGSGARIDNTGGHSKMGTLISQAVYRAVCRAIQRQNGLVTGRSVFARLEDRKITIGGLAVSEEVERDIGANRLKPALEQLLLDERYTGFLCCALSISDDYQRGLVKGMDAFNRWCHAMAEGVAGKTIPAVPTILVPDEKPPVIHHALNSLLYGLSLRLQKSNDDQTRQ